MSSPDGLLAVVSSTLVDFWVEEGCGLLDPWDGELSARSLNPQFFFALAHPTTVRWVTRQVVRQPSEARYGRSPVRQVRSTQIRVLMRPAAEDFFARFLESLRQPDLGLAERELRLRPIEWRVRDLGVGGAGWMVLIDGLLVARWVEVTAAGGEAVVPAATEITYGLERLALVASDDRSLAGLQRGHCRELAAQRSAEEQELSRHLLEVLDETELMQDLERELASAERALEERLAVPAFESILRGVQHAEVLRARGAFRTLREARGGLRLTELSAACRRLAGVRRRPEEPPAEAQPAAEGAGDADV